MSTIRVSHEKNYTCIHNDAIRDSRLSFKARGLHHLLLSYPDGWTINIAHLSSKEISETDGKTAVASALKELEEKGYLRRLQTRNEHGHITGWEQVLYELPQTDIQVSRKSGKPKIGKTKSGLPESGKPGYILNTDSKEVSKEEITPLPPTEKDGGDEVKLLCSEERRPTSDFSYPDNKAESLHKTQDSNQGKDIPPRVRQSRIIEIDDLGENGQDSFLIGRRLNPQKNTYYSCSRDPWMVSQNNVNENFASWLYEKRYKKQGKMVSDAKREITNNCVAARDLWQEYQQEFENNRHKEEEARVMRESVVVAEPITLSTGQRGAAPLPKDNFHWRSQIKKWAPDEKEVYDICTDEQKNAQAAVWLQGNGYKVENIEEYI